MTVVVLIEKIEMFFYFPCIYIDAVKSLIGNQDP